MLRSAPPGEMVQIPAGSFTMGCDQPALHCSPDQAPLHEVYLWAGNAWEWVAHIYAADAYQRVTDWHTRQPDL